MPLTTVMTTSSGSAPSSAKSSTDRPAGEQVDLAHHQPADHEDRYQHQPEQQRGDHRPHEVRRGAIRPRWRAGGEGADGPHPGEDQRQA